MLILRGLVPVFVGLAAVVLVIPAPVAPAAFPVIILTALCGASAITPLALWLAHLRHAASAFACMVFCCMVMTGVAGLTVTFPSVGWWVLFVPPLSWLATIRFLRTAPGSIGRMSQPLVPITC
jgi:hypothetical protein